MTDEEALTEAIQTAFKEEGMFAGDHAFEPAEADALRLAWAMVAAQAALPFRDLPSHAG